MSPSLTLVSHALCPYVQRAAIVLKEKGVAFERRDVDLSDKPDWFLRVSPLGKTPVLLVGDAAVFESAVICEYLDETVAPRMHPDDALERARHRAWMEFGSSILGLVAAFYNAGDESTMAMRADAIRSRFEQLESTLGRGPYFAGTDFSIVDAVFAPVFRYFDVFDQVDGFRLLAGLSKVGAWRTALSQRSSVVAAVTHDFKENLHAFLRARPSALSRRLEASGQADV